MGVVFTITKATEKLEKGERNLIYAHDSTLENNGTYWSNEGRVAPSDIASTSIPSRWACCHIQLQLNTHKLIQCFSTGNTTEIIKAKSSFRNNLWQEWVFGAVIVDPVMVLPFVVRYFSFFYTLSSSFNAEKKGQRFIYLIIMKFVKRYCWKTKYHQQKAIKDFKSLNPIKEPL